MDCEYNIKEYDAIILQMVDLDRLKIIYPITTDNAVIITSLEESPITLTDYLYKIKEYSENSILYLYEGLEGESPEGKAYKATDGLSLDNRLTVVEESIYRMNTLLDKCEEYLESNEQLQNNVQELNNRVNTLEEAVGNIKYEYEIILFKITDEIFYDNDGNIICIEEPHINNEGNFTNGWDISYNNNEAIGKYIWMASTIVKINGYSKTYDPWRVVLLYDNKGNYIGDLGKYEKRIYYLSEYYINLEAPTNNYLNEGWTEEPQGVSPINLYEYVSHRYYNIADDTPIGQWSTPVVWSRWGAYGTDSFNIEYIYCAINEGDRTLDSQWTSGTNPKDWTNDTNFLNVEYIREDQNKLWFDNPVGLTQENPYQYVSVRKKLYFKGIDSWVWLAYTTPVLWSSLGKDGDISEVLGLMGPVMRFRGEWKSTETYVNAKNDTTDINSIRYIDIVLYNDKYYMVKPLDFGKREVSSQISPNLDSINWEEAEGFEFIATKALYAENAKIDYLSSNEVVILDKDPSGGDSHIVAGMTGGNSTLIHDTSYYGSGNNPVRIWAGSSSTYNEDLENSIDLLSSPFRVYNDGKFVAENAEIIGSINASSISLTGNNVFWYNLDEVTLPPFSTTLHMIAYVLLYNNINSCKLKVPSSPEGTKTQILYYKYNTTTLTKSFEKALELQLSDNNLYTLISNYDSDHREYLWVIVLQGVYYTITNNSNEVTENFETVNDTSTEDPTRVQIYINEIKTSGHLLSIEFKFKLGSLIEFSEGNLINLNTYIKLPSRLNGNSIYYTTHSDSDKCINPISTKDSASENGYYNEELHFRPAQGNSIYLTKLYSGIYKLILNVLLLDEVYVGDLSSLSTDSIESNLLENTGTVTILKAY